MFQIPKCPYPTIHSFWADNLSETSRSFLILHANYDVCDPCIMNLDASGAIDLESSAR